MSAIWGLITGDLLPYIIAALTALVGIGGAYFKGRSDAKAKAAVKDLKAKVETMETAKEVRDDVAAKSDGAVRDALRDKWMR